MKVGINIPAILVGAVELQYYEPNGVSPGWINLPVTAGTFYFGGSNGFPFVAGNQTKFRVKSIATTNLTGSITLDLIELPGGTTLSTTPLTGEIPNISPGTDAVLTPTDFPTSIGCVNKEFKITSQADNVETLPVKA